MDENNINKIRKKINFIDHEIIKMLNQRMESVVRLKKLKTEITDEQREKEVIQNISNFSYNLITPQFTKKLFTEIINESKRIQAQDLKLIGFQGEHGAYSEIAATTFQKEYIPIPCIEFKEVFEQVSNGQLQFGIVPVENSLEGMITQVNKLLIETDLKIVGEVILPIHHHLLALPETNYRDIKTVYSHPQVLAQCSGFITRNKLEPRPFYDTAGAAKMLSEQKLERVGVIASDICAEIYNLEIIKDNIEDDKTNSTRFVILSKEFSKEKGDKCSIFFSVKHEAGALFRILKVFSDNKINLTRIESLRMRSDPNNYTFILDFQGSDKDERIQKTLGEIKKQTEKYKFMGCYKEAEK